MKVEGKDLVITDPCYIAKEEDWGESFNWEDRSIKNSLFTDYEWEETGYGDGSPKVFCIPSYYDPSDFLEKMEEGDEELLSLRVDLGECGVDSGSFGVFLLDEAFEYNSEFMTNLPANCYCIISGFIGDVYSEKDENGYTHFIFKPEDPETCPILTD